MPVLSLTGILDLIMATVLPILTTVEQLDFFDRIEFHGQFTEISTIDAFKGYGYGHYKDRSAGARLVLLREKDFFPTSCNRRF